MSILSLNLENVDDLIQRSRGFLKKLTGRPTYCNPNNRQVLATIPKDIVELLIREGVEPPYIMDWTVTRRNGVLRIVLDNIKPLTP